MPVSSSPTLVLIDRVSRYLGGEVAVPELNFRCGQTPQVRNPGLHVLDAGRIVECLVQRTAFGVARLVVAEVPVECGCDRGGGLGVLAAARYVGVGALDDLVGEQPSGRSDQPGRLEHVACHHRHHHVELKVALRAAECHARIVADHLRGDHHRCLTDHRVDLAGHDRGAGLQIG